MIKSLLGVMLSGDDFLENTSEVRKNGSMTFFASIFSLCENPIYVTSHLHILH